MKITGNYVIDIDQDIDPDEIDDFIKEHIDNMVVELENYFGVEVKYTDVHSRAK